MEARQKQDASMNEQTKFGRRGFIAGTVAATVAATTLGQTRDYSQNGPPYVTGP
jgi:hypothetical protein